MPALHMTSPQCEYSTAFALPTVFDTGLPGRLRLCQVSQSQQQHHGASVEDAPCRRC